MEVRSGWTASEDRGIALLELKAFDEEDEEEWEEGDDEAEAKRPPRPKWD